MVFYTKTFKASLLDRQLIPFFFFQALKKLSEICKNANVAMSAASLSWVLQQEGIEVVIVGASTPEQMVENCKIVKLENVSSILYAFNLKSQIVVAFFYHDEF